MRGRVFGTVVEFGPLSVRDTDTEWKIMGTVYATWITRVIIKVLISFNIRINVYELPNML